jgi:hypothetical protein
MSEARLRYRVEDGTPCIDVSVRSVDRLLDQRDPAPFRDRDLDPGLVEYLVEAADDLGSESRLRVVFWLAEPCPPKEIEVAYRAHFEDTLRSLSRRNRQRRQIGASTLVVGMVLLVVLFSLSQLIRTASTGAVASALAEGLVILSWIVLWRPVDVLLFDWIPVRQERRTVEKLLRAQVEVRTGRVPFGPGSAAP